jgi:hypothetical protein
MIAWLRARLPSAALNDKVMILRASLRLPELLDAGQRAQIAGELAGKELPDGGWSLATWGRGARAQPAASAESDAYATAFALLALCEAHAARPAVDRGLGWLATHQRADGSWPGRSVNSEAAVNQLFMSDAATAYAVMALEACGSR